MAVPRTDIDPALLDRPVEGDGVPDGTLLADVAAGSLVLLVFLRHHG